MTWDGKLSGAAAGNGAYRLVVNAKGSLGATAASHAVTVDCYAPRLSAPASASVTLGKSAKFAYSVRDPYSATVKVWATVTDGTGATVATVQPGWVSQGRSHSCAWKPTLKGTLHREPARPRPRRQRAEGRDRHALTVH